MTNPPAEERELPAGISTEGETGIAQTDRGSEAGSVTIAEQAAQAAMIRDGFREREQDGPQPDPAGLKSRPVPFTPGKNTDQVMETRIPS